MTLHGVKATLLLIFPASISRYASGPRSGGHARTSGGGKSPYSKPGVSPRRMSAASEKPNFKVSTPINRASLW